jgi:hypothetical protein
VAVFDPLWPVSRPSHDGPTAGFPPQAKTLVQYDNRQLTNRLRAGTLSKSARRAVLIAFGVLLAALAIPAARTFQTAQKAARGSAKYALLDEMTVQLDAWPEGKDYPATLSELHLTYPDGGDESLLKEFTYKTTGRTCSIRVTPFRIEVVREFPERRNQPGN